MRDKNLARFGKLNGNYKDGRTLKEHFCKCGNSISWQNDTYGTGLCHSCGLKESPLIKNRLIIIYCCMDCGNLISLDSALHGEGRCHSCAVTKQWDNKNFRSNRIKEIHIGLNFRRTFKGKNNPNYKDGRTSYIHQLRNSKKFKIWRLKIFERDNYTCQKCNIIGGKLESHHLEGFHWCKQLRFEISNGITLCETCHDKFHKIYTNFWNTTIQFLEILYEQR